MIDQIQKYLADTLVKAGITTTVYFTMVEVELYGGVHLGAVIIDKDSFNPYKRGERFSLEDKTFRRVQKFKRETVVKVIIGEHDLQSCDTILTKFLTIVDKGFYDTKGNYVYLELQEAKWVSDKDGILKSAIAIELPIKCTSDIFNDFEFVNVTPDIEVVEKAED